MNARPSRRKLLARVFLWCGVGLCICFAALGYLVYGVVSLSRDARTLKTTVLSSLDVPTDVKVQLSAGPALLGAARHIVPLFQGVPAEAEAVLRAVKSGSVGVFQLTSSPPGRRVECVQAAHAAMAERGWSRVVAVNDGSSTVLIYAPNEPSIAETLRFCLAVIEDRNVVIVAAQVDAAELLPLLRDQRFRRTVPL